MKISLAQRFALAMILLVGHAWVTGPAKLWSLDAWKMQSMWSRVPTKTRTPPTSLR